MLCCRRLTPVQLFLTLLKGKATTRGSDSSNRSLTLKSTTSIVWCPYWTWIPRTVACPPLSNPARFRRS